jgi:hypothetical protein
VIISLDRPRQNQPIRIYWLFCQNADAMEDFTPLIKNFFEYKKEENQSGERIR